MKPATRERSAPLAPTPRARRLRSTWRSRVALVAAIGFGIGGGSVAGFTDPAFADDYPSWQDVQDAKSSEAATSAKVTELEGIISRLQTEAQRTQTEAETRGAEYQVAQQKFDDAARRATDLQQQADAAKAASEQQGAQAGRLAAQLYKAGGSDLATKIFLSADGTAGKNTGQNGQGPDKLLSELGNMTQLTQRTNEIYQRAEEAKNVSTAISAQAGVARVEREKLRDAAQVALKAATEAAEAAAAALAEQEKNIVVIQAQLDALKDATAKTVAGYEAGVSARAAAAAAAAAAAGRTGPGAGLPGGYVSSSGWANPVSGSISDGFGPRVAPCSGCSSWHYGIDISTSCATPIYAAHDGTVIYAGPNGSYGNFVLLDNGGGITTGYAHIRPGGIFVGVGQSVSVGDNIASVGTTGASTGCHLHFEVRVNGSPINGIPFMAERGAPLG